MVSTEVKLKYFIVEFLEHSRPDSLDNLSKVALSFKEMHEVFKNKAQGVLYPLKEISKTVNEIGRNIID